jgi:hypothetical protein
MRSLDVFILTYSALSFSTIVLLSLLGVNRIDIYVALFAIEFFVASIITSPSSPLESRRKTIMGILLLAIFAVIIVQRIVEILG